jgi:hypothetical protein
MNIPPYIAERIRRRPIHQGKIEHAIPVVFFGNFEQAQVATLGINPSKHEFKDKNGRLLSRFATLPSLGAENLETLSDLQVATAYQSCLNYFIESSEKTGPYKSWFNRLEHFVLSRMEVSYYNGSACHLDLVQSATDPIWRGLSPEMQHQLLDDEASFLFAQLEKSNIKTLLINGRTAFDIFQAKTKDLQLLNQERLMGTPNCDMFKWSLTLSEKEVNVYGWSNNLQSTRGLTNNMRARIGEWISSN